LRRPKSRRSLAGALPEWRATWSHRRWLTRLLIRVRLPLTIRPTCVGWRRFEELGYAAQHEASEATRQGGRIPSRAAGRRDTYFKTKNKLETQRREVDTKINAASGQRFLTNLPRDREELKAAYEDGNPIT
jgi:hypothetical protein